MEKKRVPIFLLLTFVLSWGLAFCIWKTGGLDGAGAFYLLAGMMMLPTLGVVLTRLLTREGWLDWWLLPHNFKQTWPIYLLAWFLPSLLIMLGGALWFALNPERFDPAMGYGMELLRSQAEAAGQTVTDAQLRSGLVINLLVSVLLAPLLNIITCMGEELGWRGYLLPRLAARFKPALATLLVGVIWGVWHAPIIAMGHNYGLDYPGWPWLGIGAMILFCVAVGYLLGWMALTAQSALPAALAHGALNGMVALPLLFLIGAGNPFIGPAATGIIGGSGFVAAGIVCWWLLTQSSRPNFRPRTSNPFQLFNPIFVRRDA